MWFYRKAEGEIHLLTRFETLNVKVMKYGYMLMILVYPFITMGQGIIHFNDTISFQIMEREDTIDINHSVITPYPDTLELDLDCDGDKDIKFNCYTTPIPNFPSAHNIEILNLVGSDLEFLNTNSFLQAFRMDDEINLDSIDGWESQNSYKLLYFTVLGGASWAGVSSKDSVSVNNMYLIFRKMKNGECKYGWINYSGQSWPATLFVDKMAFDKTSCLQTNAIWPIVHELEIILFPNPFAGRLNISIPHFNHQNIKYSIYNMMGELALEGKITGINTELGLGQLLGRNGIYLLQIIIDDKISKSHILLKMNG